MNMDTIIALDIGAQKIKVAAGYKDDDGVLAIEGVGTANTEGFENGYIKDMEKLSNKIFDAITDLHNNWGKYIEPSTMPIFYSVSGQNLSSRNIETEMSLIGDIDEETKTGKVSDEDIERQKKALEALAGDILPKGTRKLTIITQCFQIDKKLGIKNPRYMHGREIRAAGLLVTDSQSHILDLENAIVKAIEGFFDNFEKNDCELIPVASSIASAMAVLNDETDESCVAVLDIGKGCSDLSVFYMGNPVFIWSREFAGDVITKEIKKILNISSDEAENIKKEYAYASPKKAGIKETIDVGEGNTLPLEILAQWVHEPVADIFNNVSNALDGNIARTTYKDIISQIILTGGTANLKEIAFVGQEVLNIPVKKGKSNVKICKEYEYMNDDTTVATLLGLFNYGFENYTFPESAGRKRTAKNTPKVKSAINLGEKITGLFNDFKETIFRIEL